MIAKADGLTAPRRAWPLALSQLCNYAVTPWQGNPGSGMDCGYVESNRTAFLSHRPGTAVTCRRPLCSLPCACIDTTRFPRQASERCELSMTLLTEARRQPPGSGQTQTTRKLPGSRGDRYRAAGSNSPGTFHTNGEVQINCLRRAGR